MICDNCDRENIIKALCYFSRNPIVFEIAAGESFGIENFVRYAVEMKLRCRLVVTCKYLTREQVNRYWSFIEPVLKKILQSERALEDQSS